MHLSEIKINSPYLFKSDIYGDTAVHVTAIHGGIVHFTIDGGESSRQVRDFPELSDGRYFCIADRLHKRPARRRKTAGSFGMVPGLPETKKQSAEDDLAGAKAALKNTVREVPGVGKVAVITEALHAEINTEHEKRRRRTKAADNTEETF